MSHAMTCSMCKRSLRLNLFEGSEIPGACKLCESRWKQYQRLTKQLEAAVRATVLEEVALWLEGFDFPEAKSLATQARVMAKDALED